MNRRQFLKGTAAAGAAAVLPLSILPEKKEGFIEEVPPRELRGNFRRIYTEWTMRAYYRSPTGGLVKHWYGKRTFGDLVDEVREIAKKVEKGGGYVSFGGEEVEKWWNKSDREKIYPDETILVIFEKGELRLPKSAGGDWLDLDIALWLAQEREKRNG